MIPGNIKERQLAEREKDQVDIQQAAELAETAAAYFAEAEAAVREEGSAYSLARFAYQVQKSGLGAEKFFAELHKRVDNLDRITKEKDQDKDALDWALLAIASWQYLSGQEDAAEETLEKISDIQIKGEAFRRIGTKLIDQKKDPAVVFGKAEALIARITDQEERQREARGLARDWAQAGRRDQVERVIKKFIPDDPSAQQEELVDLARYLFEHGAQVEDIFLDAFKNEDHPITEFYKTHLIEGLIQTGHYNEALVLLLEQPNGDSPELDDAWIIFAQAQAAGNQEAATAAWKVIASVSELDPELVGTTGIALARAGEETSANAMLTVLDQAEKNSPADKRRLNSIPYYKDLIRKEIALQFVTRHRPEAEKKRLVTERFRQPLASAVKELLVKEISDPHTKVDGLVYLAEHIAKKGLNPNMFKIVEALEDVIVAHPGEFATYQKVEIYLGLAEEVAKGLALQDGSMKEPKKYVEKAIGALKDAKNFPPPPDDYLHERLWVAKVRIAAAATKGARERLTGGTKTKTKTSAQLNRLNISQAGQKLIAAIRPAT